MAELDDLHRLAPTIDGDAAGAAFRRRRHRSRSMRRGALAAAAVLVMVAGTVAVAGNLDDDSPLVAGPASGTSPVTFEVLTIAQASDQMGKLRSATTAGEYVNLWKSANTSDPRPEVDFHEQVVVSITIPDDACPPELTAFERAGDVITPTFVEPTRGCDLPLIPKTYVVALDRASVEPAFTLRLPADDIYGFAEQRLRVELGGEGDLPTVWAQQPFASADGMQALVQGTLQHDGEHDCFLIGPDDGGHPVVWPAGTKGTADGPGVELPDGEIARVGDEVYGSGGYLQVAHEYDIPAECLPESGEVAVFNPDEDVTVTPPAATVDPTGPTCTEIERFAEQLVDTGIDIDYSASASPEALFARSDLVLKGTLTGGSDVRAAADYQGDVGYEVDVQAVYKRPLGTELNDPMTVWVAFGKYGPDGAPYRDAIAVGAPVLVFAAADETSGRFTASIEGFATGCSGGRVLGFVGRSDEWAELETLDDLVVRIEAADAQDE